MSEALTPAATRYLSFTQPVCDACWNLRWRGATPARLWWKPRSETCCYCCQPTDSGIYIREDPATVRCPKPLEDEP